jgi:hypothetical protein
MKFVFELQYFKLTTSMDIENPLMINAKEGMVKDVCFIDCMYYKWKDFLSYLLRAIKDLDGQNSFILKVVANQ